MSEILPSELIKRNGKKLEFDSQNLLALKTNNQFSETEKLKVAAYCRVSTEEELQLNSLNNQIIYYTNYISSNNNWKFAGVFTDSAKTGTKINNRTGFNKMIRYALEWKIDLILCKSISRFARNVSDTLKTIRILKEKGVHIFFEKENMYTGNMQSEFILTMLSAIAQDESRNISENVKWANTKRFERGEPIFSRLLGYKKSSDNCWTVIKEEAEIVKEAFEECKNGKKNIEIARSFIKKGYRKSNGRIDWTSVAIYNLLTNEKYVGDALCQKTYVKDHLTHKVVKNNGEKKQYLIKNHHEAIIDRDTFNEVQKIIKRKKQNKTRVSQKKYSLSGRLICWDCGGKLHRYKCEDKITWRCSNRVKSSYLCNMSGINEEQLQKMLTDIFIEKYQMNISDSVQRKINILMKELKNSEARKETNQNILRLKLEKALFAESTAVFRNEEDTELIKHRIYIENIIHEKESHWNMFDDDYIYRKKAMQKLTDLKNLSNPIDEFNQLFESIEFIRAWIISIRIKSHSVFSIAWTNED